MEPSVDPMLGRVLKGLYRVDAILGRGGMGVVYRGTQLNLGKPVAIKMLLTQSLASESDYERFKREALLASRFVHPGVAQVFDYGIEDRSPFIVMEYVEGVELTEAIQLEAPFPALRALAIIRQLVSVLQEAHRHQLVHRDLKPANLRLMRYVQGGAIYLKVLDFGIAKQFGTDGTALTTTGTIIGTPRYMAPEQADINVMALDSRADQYSAGVILYELLTGRPPFDSASLPALLLAHATKPPPPLPDSVPTPVRMLVERMLKKHPDERFPNPDVLEQEIARCDRLLSSSSTHSENHGWALQSSPLTKSSRIKWVMAGGAGLSVALLAALLGLSRSRITPAETVVSPRMNPVGPEALALPDLGAERRPPASAKSTERGNASTSVQTAAPKERPAGTRDRPKAKIANPETQIRKQPTGSTPPVSGVKSKGPTKKDDDFDIPVVH